MNSSPVTKRALYFFLFFSILIVIVKAVFTISDKRTKIIFCDVGQGDAAYIRIRNKIDVLIDAGPDQKILSCLGKYMPFWDRKIEVAFLSHPNNDHYNGYFFITDRYQIERFVTVDGPIASKTYKKLLNKLSDKSIPIFFKFSGDKIIMEDVQFTFYWPPVGFTSSNDNDFSNVVLFESKDFTYHLPIFKILFTGDASPFILGRLSHGSLGKVDILKVPHHGSKNGLTKIFLDLADPKVAVISVGKNNAYGHPYQTVLDLLKAKNISIRRTDEEGNIVFKIN